MSKWVFSGKYVDKNNIYKLTCLENSLTVKQTTKANSLVYVHIHFHASVRVRV